MTTLLEMLSVVVKWTDYIFTHMEQPYIIVAYTVL